MKLKRCIALALSLLLTAQTVAFAASDTAVVTDFSIGGSAGKLVYVDMVPGRVGEVGLANNSVVSVEPVSDIIQKQGNSYRLLASVNGGYFNAYYSGSGTSFPDNCPRLYATVLKDGRLVNGGGNTKLPTIGFTKDGTAIMDMVSLIPMVYVNGEPAFSTWGVNSYFSDPSAIMHFTREMTLTVPLTSACTMAVIEDGVVTRVAPGESINISSNMDVLAFNSNAYADPPAVGSRVTFGADPTSARTEDQGIWDNVVSAISVGPMLVNNSQNVARNNPTFTEENQQPDAVTLKGFVGVMNDGRVVLGTVTASNVAIADYLISIGCTDAMSMDGGASTMLYTPSAGFIQPGGRNFANVFSILDRYEAPAVTNVYTGMTEPGLDFDSTRLDSVSDTSSAVSLMQSVVAGMSQEQISSSKAKDELAKLSEEIVARAAEIETEGDVVIDNDTISDAVSIANNTKAEMDRIIAASSLTVKNTEPKIRIRTSGGGSTSISKKNITAFSGTIEVAMDQGSVEMDSSAVTDLTVTPSGTNKIEVTFDQPDTTNKVTVKFPGITTDNYLAVADQGGNILPAKYNPLTDELTTKISESGVFTTVYNEKDFTDIKNADAAVQSAIKNLASKGIISGTSETTFSPDSPITRAEIAALVARILNADDPNADGGFSDVTRANWYFGSAGSAKREGIIAGYEDNTFRGTVVIPKVQITAVLARTLKNKMGYLDVAESNLSIFSDMSAIPQWARADVALAENANMIIARSDLSFNGDMQMTRGDAALVLEKLYEKVW